MKEQTIRKWAIRIMWLVLIYVGISYLALPRVWFHREHQPGLEKNGALTETTQGIPGDPLNVGLVADKGDLIRAMHLAGWFPADAITLKSSIGIVLSVAFDRPDKDAPVSTLLYEGRKQDLAFEQPIGNSADRRNHVRFWQVLDKGAEGRPVWLGSATEDAGVGLSRDTGQVTHRIAPDIDTERNLLISELVAAKIVTTLYQVSGVGPTVDGHNGEGDWYHTDGEIRFAVISVGAVPVAAPPTVESDPPLIRTKDMIWKSVSGLIPYAQ
jgi:hypothetical protein